jgi:pimeloyl-ACP methyl ester carboxylesterase
LEETARMAGEMRLRSDTPLVIISSGDRTAAAIDRHRQLAVLSSQSRHLVATKSGHWIQFDQPDLVVDAIHDIVERTHPADAG